MAIDHATHSFRSLLLGALLFFSPDLVGALPLFPLLTFPLLLLPLLVAFSLLNSLFALSLLCLLLSLLIL